MAGIMEPGSHGGLPAAAMPAGPEPTMVPAVVEMSEGGPADEATDPPAGVPGVRGAPFMTALPCVPVSVVFSMDSWHMLLVL